MRPFKLPEATSAQNIIVDFRINLIRPKTTFYDSPGPQFETLKTEEIKNKLVETVYNVDPKAQTMFKELKIALVIGVIIIFAVLLVLILSIEDIYPVVAVGGVAGLCSILGYNAWTKQYSQEWTKKVVPKIVEYAKKDFKKNYETLDIHILYPIRKFSNVITSDWMVIRITNGRLQQPVNAPVHWTSNGEVTPQFQNNIPLLVQMQQQQQKIQQQMMNQQNKQQPMQVQQQMEQMQQMQQQMQQQMLQLQQQNNNQNTQETKELPV